MIARAPAKLNLALVVGPVRPDGKHELVTIFQRVDLADRIDVEPASDTTIKGFPADTLVRRALEALHHLVAAAGQHLARAEGDRHHADQAPERRAQQLDADAGEQIAHQTFTLIMLFIHRNPSVHSSSAKPSM